MRTCPKCDHKSGPKAEHCDACGYQIVMFLSNPKPKPKRAPKPRKPAGRMPTDPRRDRTFDGVDATLIAVDEMAGLTDEEWSRITDGLDEMTCGIADDLIESGVL